ncbi:MAG: 1,4-alpha-glucan branching protein domain-containing protein [Candidatus Omnitrophota bacterium]
MEKGYLAFVLHAHLPFVRHPEHKNFLEESWFYEGLIETYIPFIKMVDGLLNDNVDFRITISLSPTLISMLEDELLNKRFEKKLESLLELSFKEIERTRYDNQVNNIVHMYNNIFKDSLSIYRDQYSRRLLNAFKKFDSSGKVEVITCAGTHGFLPLMEMYPEAVRAQVKIAHDTYKRIFGHGPKGIWLPECGFYPGVDNILKEFAIKYFIVDTHGVLFAEPRPKFGVYSSYFCESGVSVFGRDIESSKAVWSAEEGYPGDFSYREFYRDIGYDLDYEYIKSYLNGDGARVNTGIKYHRITGRTDYKEYYDPYKAKETAASHAENFIFNRQKQIEYLYDKLGRRPIILSPYDAELYGHWWFEGIDWLNFVIRKICYDQNIFKLIAPSEYLKLYDSYQMITPSFSSWGWKGYSEVWLEGSNDWIYPHLHKMIERMSELANEYPNANGDLENALNHLARELVLAQASDWAFMMKTNIFTDYACRRTKDHIEMFNKLYDMVKNNHINTDWLRRRRNHYNLFPDIDYRVYARK